jgi:protein-S-isoprenylcysteine O-methyltransferase Ste14
MNNSKLMPYMQAFAVVVVLLGFFGAYFAPMIWSNKPDPALVETIKSIVLILIGFLFGTSAQSMHSDITTANEKAAAAEKPTAE